MTPRGCPVNPQGVHRAARHNRPGWGNGVHPSRSYMSLLELVQRIVDVADRDALEELHQNRPLFRFRLDESLLLVEYVMALKYSPLARRWCGGNTLIMETAADLTVSKFSDLPDNAYVTAGIPAAQDSPATVDGVDCRHYFRAFLDYATGRLQTPSSATAIGSELLAAETLQKMVLRHHYYSCLESRRRAQKLVRRYGWKLDGYTLYLWMPLAILGKSCRDWLETHIPNVNPARPGERDRVQAIVDELAPRRRIFSWEELPQASNKIAARRNPASAWLAERMTAEGLAKVVAQEKAANIEKQRPRIRQLGRQKLQELIHRIFAGIAGEEYQEADLAAAFGLSKATFSRFAGSQWSRRTEDIESNNVPDLWRNTAETMARHEEFVAAAREARIWPRLQSILEINLLHTRRDGNES